MDSDIIYNVFLFIVIPLLLTLAFGDKKSKSIFGFLIIGISMCLLASEVNALIYTQMQCDYFFFSTTISPIVEEILKTIPLAFAVVFIMDSPETDRCVSLGLATGVGFAIFENITLFFQSNGEQTILMSFLRGISAGLMHSICGAIVGFMLSFVRKYGRGHFFGLLGILSGVMIYHGIYNVLVQSELRYIGIALPIVSVIILIPLNMQYVRVVNGKSAKPAKASEKSAQAAEEPAPAEEPAEESAE